MTRLRSEDIAGIAARLKEYDAELVRKTGANLREIACHAAGLAGDAQQWQHILDSLLAAVVPSRAGKGIIPGFCPTVKEILTHIGINAFVTRHSDAAGLAEAVARGVHLVFMADDECFAAIHLQKRAVIDNARAAASGFLAGLDLMTGGLKGKRVLVLGCGPVGRAAVETLLACGAKAAIFDTVPSRSLEVAAALKRQSAGGITIEGDLCQALAKHRLIFEASDAAGIIDEKVIDPQTYIAAPGMPLGLSAGAVEKIGDRLIHDPLQIGVAAMAIEAVRQGEARR